MVQLSGGGGDAGGGGGGGDGQAAGGGAQQQAGGGAALHSPEHVQVRVQLRYFGYTTIIFNIQVSVRGGLECGLSRGKGHGEKDSHVAIIISLGFSNLDLFLSNT